MNEDLNNRFELIEDRLDEIEEILRQYKPYFPKVRKYSVKKKIIDDGPFEHRI